MLLRIASSVGLTTYKLRVFRSNQVKLMLHLHVYMCIYTRVSAYEKACCVGVSCGLHDALTNFCEVMHKGSSLLAH